MLRRFFLALPIAVVFALAASLLAAPASAVDAGPPPSSMAALGDSITRGFNACGWYVDCTSRSWSTGSDSYVNSHRLRIARVNTNFSAQFNFAVSGAKADGLPGQANNAVAQRVQYVTIAIGANDACTPSEAGMTPVATFGAHIDNALAALRQGLPDARVFVASVPDIKRLWLIAKDNSIARSYWSSFGICQSMLANPTSTAQADNDRRDRVRQRVIDYNTRLGQACAMHVQNGGNCKFDGNAVFNYPFALSQVSGWDYFHPNRAGQQAFAQVTYAAGFGW